MDDGSTLEGIFDEVTKIRQNHSTGLKPQFQIGVILDVLGVKSVRITIKL